MKKVKMISTSKHRYDQRELRPGDEFEANERDVRFLMEVGRAKIATSGESKPKRYNRRDMRAKE